MQALRIHLNAGDLHATYPGETLDQLRAAYADVRKENLEGRLYPIPDDPTRRMLLDALVECKLATVIPGTRTSLPGYVIHSIYDCAKAPAVGRA